MQNFKFISTDAKDGALLCVVVPLHVPPHVAHHPHNLAPPKHYLLSVSFIKMPPSSKKLEVQSVAQNVISNIQGVKHGKPRLGVSRTP